MSSGHLAQCFASWKNSVHINYSFSVLKYSRCGSCSQVQIQSRSLWVCGACQGYFAIDALIQSKFIHKEEEPKDGRHDHKKWSERPFSSVQSLSCVRIFVTPWTAAPQASLSITNTRSLLKLMSIESVMPSTHLILCRPLLLLPSNFPSIRVFSKESVLHIRWPKYWNFSFSISPSMNIQDWIVCSNPFCIVCCPWGHWRAKRQWVVPVFIRIKKWLYQLQPELCWCHLSELAPFQWVNILPPSP